MRIAPFLSYAAIVVGVLCFVLSLDAAIWAGCRRSSLGVPHPSAFTALLLMGYGTCLIVGGAIIYRLRVR